MKSFLSTIKAQNFVSQFHLYRKLARLDRSCHLKTHSEQIQHVKYDREFPLILHRWIKVPKTKSLKQKMDRWHFFCKYAIMLQSEIFNMKRYTLRGMSCRYMRDSRIDCAFMRKLYENKMEFKEACTTYKTFIQTAKYNLMVITIRLSATFPTCHNIKYASP